MESCRSEDSDRDQLDMKYLNLYIMLFILLLASHNLLGMTAKTYKYDRCPKDKQTRIKLHQEATRKLSAVSGRGEGGKLNTLGKKAAAEKYKLRSECLKKYGDIPLDAKKYKESLLLSCDSTLDPSKNILTVDMEIKEKEAYASLKRVEISMRDSQAKEYFRAMNNRMPYPAPFPPNVFGVYPVGEKDTLTDQDIKGAGHEAAIPVQSKYGNLVKGCHTSWEKGILTVHWQIHPVNWKFSDGMGVVMAKIVPADVKNAAWISCGSFRYPSVKIHSKRATITPQFHDRYSHQKIKEGTFSTVMLVKLKRVPTTGVIIQKKRDTPEKYRYVEVSRKVVDLGQNRSLLLDSGFYRFEYNDVSGDPPSGFYGKSDVFEVKGGGDMVIDVFVGSAL